jgi:hypothetical protein
MIFSALKESSKSCLKSNPKVSEEESDDAGDDPKTHSG